MPRLAALKAKSQAGAHHWHNAAMMSVDVLNKLQG
jgi:hypothetical protein